MKEDDMIRYNWARIEELLSNIDDEKTFRKIVFLYKDIVSRTPHEWEKKQAEQSLEWILQQRPHSRVKIERSAKAEKITHSNARETTTNYVVSKGDLKDVRYTDIGGLDNVISQLREIVELPFRHPELFERLGIEPAKGVLLHGPPGCGKTLLAKAVANESEASFFSINGPEIMSKYYGVAQERLREVFRQAQENSPAIIFFDELDAIAPKRESTDGEEERRIVAQLLALMDGFKERGQVVVIGATNAIDLMDPALRRPGRFDREIEVDPPDLDGCIQILEIHSKRMPLADDVILNSIAYNTVGYSGAELAAVCREAGHQCLRRHKKHVNNNGERIPNEVLNQMEVSMEDFETAIREVRHNDANNIGSELKTSWDSLLKGRNTEEN